MNDAIIIPYLVLMSVISTILSGLFVGAWRALGRQRHALAWAACCAFGALAFALDVSAGLLFTARPFVFPLIEVPLTLTFMAVLVGYQWRRGKRAHLRLIAGIVALSTIAHWLVYVPWYHVGLQLALIPFLAGMTLLLTANSVRRDRNSASTAENAAMIVIGVFGFFELIVCVVALQMGQYGDDASLYRYRIALFSGLPPLYLGVSIATLFVLMSDQMTVMDELRRELDIKRIEAEALARNKSTLLQNMTHEIRSPLGSMTLLANMLARAADLPEAERRWAQRLNLGGQRVSRLLNDILDFSKLEEGRVALAPVPTDLAGLLSECLELVACTTEQRDVALKLDIASDVPPMVLVDGPRFQQIIDNLLANAARFTATGSITLRAMRASNPTYLEINVVDTGAGIPADKQPFLFARFQQVDGALAELGGSGLGLSICRALVDLMHGDIGLASIEGQGTTIWLTIPLLVEDEAAGLLIGSQDDIAPDPTTCKASSPTG